MMGFEDLDVPALDKLRRHLFDEPGKKRHPDRGVGAVDKRDRLGRLGERRLVGGGQPGGADDKRTSRIGGDGGMRDAGRRAGEIDDDIGAGEGGRISGDHNTVRAGTGKKPAILADGLATRQVGCCGKFEPRRGVDFTDQHAPHAPGGARNADSDCLGCHGACPPSPVAARLFSRRRLGKI